MYGVEALHYGVEISLPSMAATLAHHRARCATNLACPEDISVATWTQRGMGSVGGMAVSRVV